MAIAERAAETTWEGALASGGGTIRPASGALGEVAVTWASRTEQTGGKTGPEETSRSGALIVLRDGAGSSPGRAQGRLAAADRHDSGDAVTLDAVGGVPTIVSSDLRVRGQVPGLDEAGFQEAVGEAAGLCPVSRLFAGAEISVDAAPGPAS